MKDVHETVELRPEDDDSGPGHTGWGVEALVISTEDGKVYLNIGSKGCQTYMHIRADRARAFGELLIRAADACAEPKLEMFK